MRRFVVIAKNAEPVQQNILTKYFHSKGYGFWHWVPDTWLLTSDDAHENATSLRDTIKVLVPGLHVLVLHSPLGKLLIGPALGRTHGASGFARIGNLIPRFLSCQVWSHNACGHSDRSLVRK